MKRIICFFLTFSALFFVSSLCCSGTDDPELEMARYAYVYNPDYDRVLYSVNEDKILYPASTAKIITSILAIEYYEGALDTKITITQQMLDLASGTIVSYKPDEVVTVEQLLYGMIVANGNDATYALALSIGGSVDGFVAMMNEKAAAIGAVDTYYVNPTGIDDNKAYTTVRDVAKIAAYASKLDTYVTISSCEKYTMTATNKCTERTMANKNYLVSRAYVSTYYLSYATGLNCGTTPKGGDCCVALATKDGVTIVAVVMNVGRRDGSTVNFAFYDAKSLLQWAYGNFGYVKVLSHSEIVCEIPVTLSGSVDYVALLPNQDLYAFLPFDADIENDVLRQYNLYSSSLTAPVAEGQESGEIMLFYDGQPVGTVTLVTKNSLSRSSFLMVWTWVKKFLLNIWTAIAAVFVLLIALIVVLVNAYNRGRIQKRR